MARRYPAEVHAYIADHVVGTRIRDLARMTTEATGAPITEGQMRAYMKNHHLHNGCPKGTEPGQPSKVYPEAVKDYILEHYRGCGCDEMREQLRQVFGLEYTRNQIKGFYGRNHLDSGLTGYFEPGHVPANKGKKGVHAPGCEKGWFAGGNLPYNTKPIGYERVTAEGYIEVKIKMRPSRPDCNDNFVAKHRLVWEAAHGPIPDDCCLIFKDGNRQNTCLENLMLVTKAERLEMTRKGLFSEDAGLTESGAIVAKLYRKMYDAGRNHKKED